MQLCQVAVTRACLYTLVNAEHEGAMLDPRTSTSCRVEAIALLCSAVEALQRRRVAGTLLNGRCTAEEEAWQAAEMQSCNPDLTADDAARYASLTGYITFLRAAASVLSILRFASLFALECTVEQFQSFVQHAVHAVTLMQQPRGRHASVDWADEDFTAALRTIVAEAGETGLDPCHTQLLSDAWQRLQRSGVLQARRITGNARPANEEDRARLTATLSSLKDPGRRSCALPSCGVKEAHPQHFKSCPPAKAWCTAARIIKSRTGQATRRHARLRARQAHRASRQGNGATVRAVPTSSQRDADSQTHESLW